MKIRMLLVPLIIIPPLLITACSIQTSSRINIPTEAIHKIRIAGGLPGSPSVTLTPLQDSNVLKMLQKARESGSVTPYKDGYPPTLIIELSDGRTISISPSATVKKEGSSVVGVGAEDYIDYYDSKDISNKPQRLYAPDLYRFLVNWQQKIPKSQWQTTR